MKSTWLAVLAAFYLPLVCMTSTSFAQALQQRDKFRRLDDLLPTPSAARTASGAPGPEYWQQRADYVIDVEIDDVRQRLIGSGKITYHNRSPHTLNYLWLHLEQNIRSRGSNAALTSRAPSLGRPSMGNLQRVLASEAFDGAMQITGVKDQNDRPLKYTIVNTVMRVDLPTPLTPGESVTFTVDWKYPITNAKLIPARTGYEYFEEDGNYLYKIAQWFPRMMAYTDYGGWHHKQFLGAGEFTLEFGNYMVRITVPDDHIVAATGTLLNADAVLTDEQRKRWEEAKHAQKPVYIVTPEEAAKNESHKPTGKKTWIFQAENVRDFAFATSRKFVWDAQGYNIEGNQGMAMSVYPKEAEPLWSKYSTAAIIHALEVYSRYTVAYPYPVCISVSVGGGGGMEYPMISFNGGRPEKDGTYSKARKYGLISVIIHEVGHNFFPMIINSDERNWAWMDEGLNTFVQFLAEQEWEDNYPSSRGEPKYVAQAMKRNTQTPIMTAPDSSSQLGYSAYQKPSAAMVVLRETVLGREAFDFAFKEYARRWKFKRPTPADFFRTMEDASGVDLDWFWRGWFYGTQHVDISLENLRLFKVSSRDPDVKESVRKAKQETEPETLTKMRNRVLPKRVDKFPDLKDFYNSFNPNEVSEEDRKEYQRFLSTLSDEEKKLLEEKRNFYVIDLKNNDGLVMPVILEIEFEDGTKEEVRIPTEIWRYNSQQASKLFITSKTIKSIVLDPHLETADAERANNYLPRRIVESPLELRKDSTSTTNPMQKLKNKSDDKKQ